MKPYPDLSISKSAVNQKRVSVEVSLIVYENVSVGYNTQPGGTWWGCAAKNHKFLLLHVSFHLHWFPRPLNEKSQGLTYICKDLLEVKLSGDVKYD